MVRPAAAPAVPRAGAPLPPLDLPGLGHLTLGAAAAGDGPGAALAAALGAAHAALGSGVGAVPAGLGLGVTLPELPTPLTVPMAPVGFGLQLPGVKLPRRLGSNLHEAFRVGGPRGSSSGSAGLPDETWVHLPSLPMALHRMALQSDDLIEVAHMMPAGSYHGSVLFRVLMVEPPDVGGQYASVEFCGASSAPLMDWVGGLLAESQYSGQNLILHLCDTAPGPCTRDYFNHLSKTVHADYIRMRTAASLHESWIPNRFKEVHRVGAGPAVVDLEAPYLGGRSGLLAGDELAVKTKFDKYRKDYATTLVLQPARR